MVTDMGSEIERSNAMPEKGVELTGKLNKWPQKNECWDLDPEEPT